MREYFRRVLVLLLAVSVFVGTAPISALASEIGEQVSESFDSVSDDGALDIEEAETEVAGEGDGGVSSDSAASAGVDFLDGMEVEGADSVGNMLAEKLSDKASEQMENNGCNIFSVSMDGHTAFVDMETIEDAKVVVGIYDEKTNRLLASGEADVLHGSRRAEIHIAGIMPAYFIPRVYLVGKDDLAPLCTAYVTSLYTEDMQTFLNKTTDDFEEERVFNLDSDKTKNFLIFNDKVIRIKESDTGNNLISANEISRKYEFSEIDSKISELKNDDEISYEYSDGRVLLIKVDSIAVSGTDATIYGKKGIIEDAFDYIRIDDSSADEETTIDNSDLDSEIEYIGQLTEAEIDTLVSDRQEAVSNNVNGLADNETSDNALDVHIEGSEKITPTYKLNISKKEKGHEWGKIKGQIEGSVTGKVGLELKASFKYIKTLSNSTLELKFDYSLFGSISAEGKGELAIPLGDYNIPVASPWVNIGVTPNVVLSVSGKIEFKGRLTSTLGFCVENGIHKDLTESPHIEWTLKGEVTVFFGFRIEPHINVIDEALAEVKIKCDLGVESKAKLIDVNSSKMGSNPHVCTYCIDGDNVFNLSLSDSAKFLVFDVENERLNITLFFPYPYGDWYYSLDYDEWGWGECPHRGRQVNIFVKDKNTGMMLGNANVSVNRLQGKYDKQVETDKFGRAEFFLEDGSYTAEASLSGYQSKAATFNVTGKTIGLTIYLQKENNEGANITKISMGNYNSAAIDTNGNLWMWGWNLNGELGNGTTEGSLVPIKIMENVKEVSLGRCHSAAIDINGNLWAWGNNYYGQVGKGTEKDEKPITVPIKIMENVKEVSLGEFYSAAIDINSNLWTWGWNYEGELGNGTTEGSSVPIKIMENVKEVSLGSYHSAAIDTNGNLWMWGRNTVGQLGNGTLEGSDIPIKIMEKVKKVSLGENYSAAIDTNGDLWTWGSNFNGELGNGTTEGSLVPIKIMENVKEVSQGRFYSAAIDTNGDLWTWGKNSSYGRLGNGTTEDSKVPKKIKGKVKKVSLGETHGAAIDVKGALWTWGDNRAGELVYHFLISYTF